MHRLSNDEVEPHHESHLVWPSPSLLMHLHQQCCTTNGERLRAPACTAHSMLVLTRDEMLTVQAVNVAPGLNVPAVHENIDAASMVGLVVGLNDVRQMRSTAEPEYSCTRNLASRIDRRPSVLAHHAMEEESPPAGAGGRCRHPANRDSAAWPPTLAPDTSSRCTIARFSTYHSQKSLLNTP